MKNLYIKRRNYMFLEAVRAFFVAPEQIINLVISLFLGILLGIGIAYVYKYTHRGMNYERSFLTTIVLISPIVTMVMYFIQGDLVVSLGLVGSLSIIRFRTPIKDTCDMVFLFCFFSVVFVSCTGYCVIMIVVCVIV